MMYTRKIKPMRKQAGLTLVSWLGVIMVGLLAVILVIRLLPPTLDSMAVKDSLKSLATEHNISAKSDAEIRELFARRLYVNNIKNVDPKKLEIKKAGNGLIFKIQYELRVHAIHNIDAVMVFDQSATSEK